MRGRNRSTVWVAVVEADDLVPGAAGQIVGVEQGGCIDEVVLLRQWVHVARRHNLLDLQRITLADEYAAHFVR